MKRLPYIIFVLLTFLFLLIVEVKAETINRPIIELNGDHYIYLQKGTEYYEYGALATDVEDGDLTSNIEIDASSLNINQVGLYKITYSVTDSNLNETVKERFVQVFEKIYEEKNLLFSGADIIASFPLIDDSFIVFTQVDNQGFINIIDKWGNEQKKINFLENIYLNKIIETKDNNYFIIGRNEIDNNAIFIKVNINGEVLSQSSENLDVIDVTEYQDNEFILTDGNNLFYFTDTNFQETINLQFTIDNIESLPNGDIVYYHNDIDKVKIYINELEKDNILDVNLSDMFTYNEKIIFVGNTISTNLGCIYILNQEGNIITSKTYAESFLYTNLVNDKLLVYTENAAGLVIETASLNIISSHHFSQLNLYQTISINGEEQILFGSHEQITLITPNINFSEFANISVFVNEPFDVDTNIKITNFTGELLEYEINSVDEALDTSIIGIHELTYNLTVETKAIRLTRKVTVLPIGVVDRGIYNTPITINIGDNSALLNGVAYNNEEICEAGNYELMINGLTINFALVPDYNIESDGRYKQGMILVNPGVTATYFVDGENYLPGNPYYEIGHHTLTVISDNGYYYQINFTIIENIDIVDYQEFTYKAVFDISYADLEVDGESYISGSEISDVGIHELKIIGTNGYENTYIFIIKEKLDDFYDGIVFDYEAIIEIPYVTRLEINGEEYIPGTKFYKVGNHELKIIGTNGYENTYTFTIKENLNDFYDGKVFSYEAIIEISHAILEINGKPYQSGSKFYEVGNNVLKIIGNNGYETTYTFTVTEDLRDFYDEKIFNYEAIINILHANLEIDGESYIQGTKYYQVGLHYLKVIGNNGYEKTYIFTITERVSHLEDEGVYIGSVTPFIPNATLELDGKLYSSGTKITEIGHHILTVKGSNGYVKEYRFTIDFETPGLEDGGVYTDSVTPIIIGGTATLNGEKYYSGTKITEIGHHSLVIIGENNYQKEITFTIKSGFLGKTYTSSVNPNINAELMTLNGSVYKNEIIDSVGNYELAIMGRGGFKQTISFKIIPKFGVEDGKSYDKEVIPIISSVNAIFEIDGKPYTPGDKIDIVGHHTLTVIGNSGYDVNIDFTIIEEANIQNDSVHHQKVIIDIPNAELVLNGEPYINGTEVNLVGNHILKIIGTNGYEKIINFVITPEVNIVENGEYEAGLIIEVNNIEKIHLNNLLYEGEEITYAGNYELIIYGINDYSVKYNFIIKEKLFDIEPNGVYLGEVYPKIENGEILINGIGHKSGTKFTDIGIHELTVVGLNGYEKTYYFTIEPIIEGVEDGKTYKGSVSINIVNAEIKLNNEGIPNKGTIYDVGNNIITIYGNGGYKKTITFTITPIIEGIEENKTYYNSIKINIPNAKLYIDGIEYENGTEYKKIGKHTLTIVGANDYRQEIDFTLKYSTNVLIQQIVIIAVPVAIIIGMIFIVFRLRRKVI